MKRILPLVIAIIVLLWGCKQQTNAYPFINQDEQIESISLYYFSSPLEYSGQDFEWIKDLEKTDFVPFMESVRSIKTQYCITPPPANFGNYIAQVTYNNGELEIFAQWHIEHVDSGDTITGVGAYRFIGTEFEELFLRYAQDRGRFSVLRAMKTKGDSPITSTPPIDPK